MYHELNSRYFLLVDKLFQWAGVHLAGKFIRSPNSHQKWMENTLFERYKMEKLLYQSDADKFKSRY